MNNTKLKILDVADDLVQHVGLNAMSYKHISDVIGIRKASIHHHFPKKENLVEELLKRCDISYGERYRIIVEGVGQPSEKLRNLAGVFKEGLISKKVCLVGSISTNSNTLHGKTQLILESTIKNTVDIFSTVFEQGRDEKNLTFSGTSEDAGFAFFSFLVGAQTLARSQGGVQQFEHAAEVYISNFEI